MEKAVAERPISQEIQIDQRQRWHNGSFGTNGTKYQEDPSQSLYARRQTSWTRTHIPNGSFGSNSLPQDKCQTQVCRDFIRGTCSRGTFCRYQHHESSAQDGRVNICRGFMRGTCNFGSSCKYLHSESDKNYGNNENLGNIANPANTENELRRSFPREPISRSPCRRFQSGRCHNGAACRYLHPENATHVGSWSAKLQQGLVVTTARNPSFGEGNIEVFIRTPRELDEANKGNYVNTRNPCRNFLNNRCYQGSNCPYLHIEHNTTGYGRPNYDWGPHHHQGVAESSGYHSFNKGSTNISFRTSQAQGGVNKNSDMRTNSFPREPRSKSPCRKFQSGNCYRGADCSYLHPVMYDYSAQHFNHQGPAPTSCNASHAGNNNVKNAMHSSFNTDSRSHGEFCSEQPKQEFCLKFSKGRCDRGDSCRYLHSYHNYARSVTDMSAPVSHDGVLDEKKKRESGDDTLNPNVDQKGEKEALVMNLQNSGGVVATNSDFAEADKEISLWSQPFKRRRSRSPVTPRGGYGRSSVRREEFPSRDRHLNVVPFLYQQRGSYQNNRPRYHRYENSPHSKVAATFVDSPKDSRTEILKQKSEFELAKSDVQVQSSNVKKEDMSSGVAAPLGDDKVMSNGMLLDQCVIVNLDSNNAILNPKIKAECAEDDVETSHAKIDGKVLVAGSSEINTSKRKISAIPEEVESDSTSCSEDNTSPRDTNVSAVSRGDDAEVKINSSLEGGETSEALKTYTRKRRRIGHSKFHEEPLKEEVTDPTMQGASKICSAQRLEQENKEIPNKVQNNVDPALAIMEDVTMLGDSDSHSMQTANSLEAATLNFRRKLLILDVNGLLADIVADFPVGLKPDTTVSMKAVFKRPFCDDFLKFCFERFDVAVWSSRTKKNVDTVIEFLLGDTKKRLLFCWDQSHCTYTGYQTVENWDKPLVLKELKKLWEKQVEGLPWEKGYYNETNTVLLDDSPYKALRNPAYTAVFPCPYTCRNVKDKSLGPGGDLRVYLERLSAAEDVQKFIQENPFGQRPITKSNLSWGFYSKIVGVPSVPKEGNTNNKPTPS